MTPGGVGARLDRVGLVLCLVATAGLIAIVARVGQLQARPGDRLAEHVSPRESQRTIASRRGELLDRRGRLLSTTRFAYRVVIDPAVVPDPPDALIVALADELGVAPGRIGEPLMARMAENDRRRGAGSASRPGADGATDGPPADGVGVALGTLWTRVQGRTDGGGEVPALVRYLAVGPLLERERADRIRELGLRGVWLERRPVREYPGGALAAPLVGKVGLRDWSLDQRGLLGAEHAFEERLGGVDGALRYVRDARGNALWVEQGSWRDGVDGQDVRLSIDLEIQRIAVRELERGVADADAQGGRIIVLEPRTGEVLAMADVYREVAGVVEFPWGERDDETGQIVWPRDGTPAEGRRYRVLPPDPGRAIHPALGRNRCVEDAYEPGSTFKPFVWGLAMERGLLPGDEVLRQAVNHHKLPYGRRSVKDVTFRKRLTWDEVLKYSSNIGMSQAAARLGHGELRQRVVELGFGRSTGLGLPGESAGLVTSARDWSDWTQTSVAMGYEVAVTPVQMVRAFSVFARDGALAGTLPTVRLTAVAARGKPGVIAPDVILERVMSADVALRTRDAMFGVVERMDARLQRVSEDEPPASYSMFGKSGTSEIACIPPKGKYRPKSKGYFEDQHTSSFVAAAPGREPRLVVLVVIDDPGPGQVRRRAHYGSAVAGPVVRRVVEQALRYLGVEPELAQEQAVAGR